MSEATVQGILEQIEQLSDEDRVALSMQRAQRVENEWRGEMDEVRRVARERGITQSDIDRVIDEMRYGK